MTTPTVLEKTLYTATATAVGGRNGHAKSDDGRLSVTIAPPKEMGGSAAEGTNPEQLFAAGYAACFGSALQVVAQRQKIDPGAVSITARVGIGPAGHTYGLKVELRASLPNVSPEQAQALVKAAHEVCPYSNATRGNIVVDVGVA